MSDLDDPVIDDVPSPGTSSRPEPIQAGGVRHPWRWVGAGVLVVLGAMLINTQVFSQTQQPHVTASRFG